MIFGRIFNYGIVLLLLVVAAWESSVCGADDFSERADSLLANPPPLENFAPWSEEISAAADSLSGRNQSAAAAGVYERLGIAAFRARQLTSAVAYWRAGLALARQAEDSDRTGSLLNALAVGLQTSGDPGGGIPVYAEAIRLKRSLADTLGLAKSWGNLTNCYAALNRLDEAMAAADSAGHWNRLSGNDRGDVAVLGHRVTILNSLGRPAEAVSLAHRAVALARNMDSEALGVSRRHLGTTLMDLGQMEPALAQMDSALSDLATAGNHYYPLYVKQDQILALRGGGHPAAALAVCQALLPELNDADHLPLLTSVEIQCGGALLDLGRHEEALVVLGDARRAFEQRLAALADESSRLGILPISGPVFAALARALLAADQPEAAWDAVEAGAGLLYRQKSTGGSIRSLAEVQAALAGEGAVLIQAAEAPPQDPLLLFVVTADTLIAVSTVALGPLLADARGALDLMASGQPDEVCAPPIARLAANLIGPLEGHLPLDCRRIYLVPPHGLWGFPWDILPLRDGRLLGDIAPVAYLPNAGSLLELQIRKPSGGPVLAVADPKLDGSIEPGAGAVPDYRGAAASLPLPEARREVGEIQASRKRVLVGRQATVPSVLAALDEQPSVLHFATHALVHPLSPDASALVLADSLGTGPAYLSAGTIAGWNLATDLVVLSGCRTGQMGAALGEGPLGLPRAFLLAGSRAVVTSLWDVEDKAARTFMAAFYRAQNDGADPARALGMARRELTANGFNLRDRAAFVISGSSGEALPALARTAYSVPWQWLILALVVGSAVAAWWRRAQRRRPADRTV